MSDKNARSYKPDLRGSKQKFQSISTSAFKNKGLDQAGKGPVPYSKPGLASLGKVSGRRIPKPHIESKRTENYGEDPDVQLVPKDGSGWAKSAEDGDNATSRKGDGSSGSNYPGSLLNSNTKLWSDPNAGVSSSQRPVRTANPNEFPTLSSGGKPEQQESSSYSLKPNRPSWKQGASGKFEDREETPSGKPSNDSVEQDSEYSHYPDMKPSFMKSNMQKSSSGSAPVFRTKRDEWKGPSANKDSRELDKIVELDKDADGWAGASGEVDYNKKIVFSDEEEGGDSGASSDNRQQQQQERKQQQRNNYTSTNNADNSSNNNNSNNNRRNLSNKENFDKNDRRGGDFFQTSSARGPEKYNANLSSRKMDPFFQSNSDRNPQQSERDSNPRRSNSFYDSRTGSGPANSNYDTRNRNDYNSGSKSGNMSINSRPDFENRRGNTNHASDYGSNRGPPNYPAPSNPPFPPSNKTYSSNNNNNQTGYNSNNQSSGGIGASNFLSHDSNKMQQQQQDRHSRAYSGNNQGYDKMMGKDEEKTGFFRGSEMNQQHRSMQKRDDMRYNSGDKIPPPPPPPPQHQTQLGSNSMGRYDGGPGGGYSGNGMSNNGSGNAGTRQGVNSSSQQQQQQQSNLRNRYDSEGSTGSGKAAADAMRGVQMNFKGPDNSGLMKNPPAAPATTATAPQAPMFFPPPPPPPQFMNQLAQQQLWAQYHQMLMAARFPFPMQPPFPPAMPLPPADMTGAPATTSTATTNESIPRPPPEGAASIAESPMSIQAPVMKNTSSAKSPVQVLPTPQSQRAPSPVDESAAVYSPPPPKEEVRTRRVQRTKKVQLTDSSQPDPSEKPADEPVKILERPKDKGKEHKAISAASLFHTPKNDDDDSSNNEAKDKENPPPARFNSKRSMDSASTGQGPGSKYDNRGESQWGDDEREFDSHKPVQSFQSKERRSGYGSNFQERNREQREYRTPGYVPQQERRQNTYDDYGDESYGYRKPRREKEAAPPPTQIKELGSPTIDNFGRSSAPQSRSLEVRRGGRGLGYSRQGPPHSSSRGRDRGDYPSQPRMNTNFSYDDEDDYSYEPPGSLNRSREDRGSPTKVASHFDNKETQDIEVKDLMSLEIRYDDLSENNRQKLQQDFLGSGSRRSDNAERYGKRFSSSAVASRGSRNPAGRRTMPGSGGSFDNTQMPPTPLNTQAAPHSTSSSSTQQLPHQNSSDTNTSSRPPGMGSKSDLKEFQSSKNYMTQQLTAAKNEDKKSESLTTQSDPVSTVSTADSAAESSSTSNSSSNKHSSIPLASSVVDWNAQNAASTLFSQPPSKHDNSSNGKEPLTIKTSTATSSSLKSDDVDDSKENSDARIDRDVASLMPEPIGPAAEGHDEPGYEESADSEQQQKRSGKGLRSSGMKTRGVSAGARWEIKSNAAVRDLRGGSSRRGGSVGGGKSRTSYYDNQMGYYYPNDWDYYYQSNYADYDYGYSQGYYATSNEYSRNTSSYYPVSQSSTSRKAASRGGGKSAAGSGVASSRRGGGRDRRRIGGTRGGRDISAGGKSFDLPPTDRFPVGSTDQVNQEEWETASESSDFERRESKNDKVPVAGNEKTYMTQSSIPSHARNEQRFGKISTSTKKSFSSQRPLADRGRDNNNLGTTASKFLSMSGSNRHADSKLSQKHGSKSETGGGPGVNDESKSAPPSSGPPKRRGPDISQYDINRMSGIVVLEDQQNMRPNIASDDDCADETFQEVISKRSKSQKAAASKKSSSPTSQPGGKEKSPRVKGGVTKRSSKAHGNPKKGERAPGQEERPSRGKSGTPAGSNKDDGGAMRNIQSFDTIQRQFSRSNMEPDDHVLHSDPASSGKTSMPTTPPPARTTNAWEKPLQTTLILQDNQLVPSLPMAPITQNVSDVGAGAGGNVTVSNESSASPWMPQGKSAFIPTPVNPGDIKKRKEITGGPSVLTSLPQQQQQQSVVVPQVPVAQQQQQPQPSAAVAPVHQPPPPPQAPRHFTTHMYKMQHHMPNANTPPVAPPNEPAQHQPVPVPTLGSNTVGSAGMAQVGGVAGGRSEAISVAPPQPQTQQPSTASAAARMEQPQTAATAPIANLDDNAAPNLFYNESSQEELNSYLKSFEEKNKDVVVANTAESAITNHTDALNLAESNDDPKFKRDMEIELKSMWENNKDDDFVLDDSSSNPVPQSNQPPNMISNTSSTGEPLTISNKPLGIGQATQSVASSLEQSRVCKVKPVTQNTNQQFRNQLVASGLGGAAMAMNEFQPAMEMPSHLSNNTLLAQGLSATQQQASNYFDDAMGPYGTAYGTATNVVNPANAATGAAAAFFDQPTPGGFTDVQTAAVVAAQQNQTPAHQQFIGQKAPQQNIGTVPPQPHQTSNNSINSAGWASGAHFLYGEQPSQNNPLGGGGLGQSANSPYQPNVFNPMANSFGAPGTQSNFGSFNFNPLMGIAPRGQQANPSHPFMQAPAQNPQPHPQHSNYGHMMGSNPLQPAMNSTSFHSPQHPGQHPFDMSLGPFGTAQGHPAGKAMSPQSHHPPGDFKPDYTTLYGFNEASAFNQAAAGSFKTDHSQSFLASYNAAKGNSQFLQASSSFNSGNGSSMQQPQLNASSGYAPNGSGSFMAANKLMQGFSKQDVMQAAAAQKSLGMGGPYSFGVGAASATGSYHKGAPNSMQMNSNPSAQSMLQSQTSAAAFGSHAFSGATNPAGPRMPPAPIQRPSFPRPRATANAIGGVSGMFPAASATGAYAMNTNAQLQKRNSGDRSSPGTGGQRPWSSDTGTNSASMNKYVANFNMPPNVAYSSGGNMQRNIAQPPQFRRDAFAAPNSMTAGPRFGSNPVSAFKHEVGESHALMTADGRVKPNGMQLEGTDQNVNEKTDVNIFARGMVSGDATATNETADMGPVSVVQGVEMSASSNEQNPGSIPAGNPSGLHATAVVEQNNIATSGPATSNPNANISIAVD